jgi:periplasmic protein TonB
MRRMRWIGRLRPTSLRDSVGVSMLLHLLVIAAVSYSWWGWARQRPRVGTVHGSRRVLLYLPGKPAISAPETKKFVQARRPATKGASLRTITEEPSTASTTSPITLHPDGATGNDAQGTDTASIMLITGFPTQAPDMSHLPAGASGDLVVEVLIDSNGRVQNARAKKGVGNGVDEMVIATVEHWLFHPVIKDGRPVMSEQELHFHYARGCDPAFGWGCFELAP